MTALQKFWFGGDLPRGWEARRIKRVAAQIVERVPEDLAQGQTYLGLEHVESKTGRVLRDADGAGSALETAAVEVADEDSQSGATHFSRGDVLFGKLRPYLGKVARPEFDGVCSAEFVVLRSGGRLDSQFLQYVLLADGFVRWINSFSFGAKMPRVDPTRLLVTHVPVPPLDEQRRIAKFLLTRTAEIDALIETKRDIMGLLNEGYGATLTSVFSELTPTARLVPLRRHVLSVEQGISPVCENRTKDEGEWGVLTLSAVSRGKFRAEEHKTLPPDVVPQPRYEVKEGDLLITRANTPNLVGDVSVATGVPPRLLLPDLIYRVRLGDQLLPEYVGLFLLSSQGRGHISSVARGSSRSMVKIRGADIKAVPIPVVPIDRQREAVHVVEARSAYFQQVRQVVEKTIAKLQEYRAAIVSAAVTGSLDLKDAA